MRDLQPGWMLSHALTLAIVLNLIFGASFEVSLFLVGVALGRLLSIGIEAMEAM